MSIWTVLVIVVTISLVVGPVAMLRPSKRDGRLADLRQMAAQKGIRVRLASLMLSSGEKPLAIYSLSLPKSDIPYAQWLLVQQSFEHALHFWNLWDWHDKAAIAPLCLHPQLKQQIQQLDASILGIEVTPHSVGVYWLEKRLEIEQVDALLHTIKDMVITK
jgi:hypothetical protein